MARDIRPGTAGPKQKPKQQHSDRGMLASATPAAPLPGPPTIAPMPPAEKPHRSLQKVGFQGSIESFNERVQRTVDAHRAAKGFDPQPGLVLDVARSAVPTEAIPHLFSFGASKLGLVAAKAAVGLDRTPPKSPADALLHELEQATRDGTYERVWNENKDQIWELARKNPSFEKKVLGLNAQAATIGASSLPKMGRFTSILQVAVTGIGQVTSSLVLGPPTLAVAEGRAVKHGIEQRSLRPLAETNKQLAKGVVRGVKEDIRHPEENPGYLFLDALGLVSAGGGTAARLSAAGKELGRAEIGGAAKALVRRPRPGTATLRKGGLEEEVLLSQNAVVRAAQRLVIGARNARMEKRLGDDASAGALSVVRPLKAQELLDRALDPLRSTFSSENKLAREGRARRRVEHQIAMTPWRELQAVAGASSDSATIYRRINTKLRGGLSIGEQKAIQVLATDDLDPLALHRDFHTRMMAEGVGDPRAHLGQLAALRLAEKVLEDPKPRQKFLDALAITRDVIAEQERLKIQELGLAPDTANKRVISHAEVLRTGRPVEPGEDLARQSKESFYLPVATKAQTKRQAVPKASPALRDAGFGIGPGRDLPELNHVFTGQSIRAGDFRVDATNLAGEAYARTVRRATVLNEHGRLWKAATDKPQSEFDRPIRDTTNIPPKLREFLAAADEGGFTGKEAEALSKTEIDDLLKLLYPGRQNEATGRWALDGPIEGVKWVDSRLLDLDRAPSSGAGKKIAQAINEPFRITTLFLRPAYILNAVGNAGMAVLHQGHLMPPNMLRALRAKEL